MFKYKVSIFLKSGNILRCRCESFKEGLTTTLIGINSTMLHVMDNSTEAIVISKWYQRYPRGY